MKNRIFCLIVIIYVMNAASVGAQTAKYTYADQGNRLAKQGNYQQALQSLTKAIGDNPSDARSFKLRGHVYYAMGDYAHALTDLDQVCALVPDSANALVDRAIVYSVMGNHGLALADVERALALKPESSFAQAVRKEILTRASQ